VVVVEWLVNSFYRVEERKVDIVPVVELLVSRVKIRRGSNRVRFFFQDPNLTHVFPFLSIFVFNFGLDAFPERQK
jgi:hypothetical protein